MATLILTRPRQYVDMLRRYTIIVDGHRRATIRRGQTISLDLPPGRHQVVAKIDWCRSNPVEIEVGPEGRHFLEVGSNLTGWRILNALAYIIRWPDRYLYLREA
jgi:hypothetical protein